MQLPCIVGVGTKVNKESQSVLSFQHRSIPMDYHSFLVFVLLLTTFIFIIYFTTLFYFIESFLRSISLKLIDCWLLKRTMKFLHSFKITQKLNVLLSHFRHFLTHFLSEICWFQLQSINRSMRVISFWALSSSCY